MHFIAMMGFSVSETPVHYDKPTTFASLGVAIVMVGIGIFIVGYRGATGTALFTGGTITGLGIASMHYLGMAGMRLNGNLEYNTLTVSASVVIAVVAATTALWAAGQVRGFLWSVGASLVMGLAVTGMHYTGMAALSVHLHGASSSPGGDSAATLLAPMMIGPLAFLCLAGVVVMFDPLMVMGKPDWTPTQQRPGVPAHSTAPYGGRRPCRAPAGTAVTAAPAPPRTGDQGPLSVRGRTVEPMRPVSKIERSVAPFEVVSPYQPSGDQPAAIADLEKRIRAGEKDVVLLGATGTGKSATTAWMIEKLQRPTLVMAPNKTLAAQLANEFRELLPNNAVEYFVSYYDYYQPEAYVPQSDTYIEKDSSINEEVERLRHSATNSLLTRRDVVVVASVSCIYGLGTPQEYVDRMVSLKVGDEIDRDDLLRRFVDIQYTRNDVAFARGTFRVRGDTIEIFPVYEELAVRIEMFGDEIEALSTLHPLTGEVISDDNQVYVFPASHYVAGPERMERAVNDIEKELGERLAELEKQGKLLEAQRLRMRTTYDLEMLRQIGSCSGVENYSMHFDGREPGSPPNTLIDYFPDDFLLVIDESHNTVPQIGAMYEGDASRKRTLVDHGFRLPSALDNRPLKWEEFQERIGQTVYLSATPGKYELSRGDGFVEQIIRPTGLIDPEVVVKPTEGQIDDLVHEIRVRTEKDERVLVTTLTKKMAEDLTDYFLELGIQVRYLHSDVDTLRRVELLRELRAGEFDVLVGINLLREGLDLPEVSLVSILDADKEGFLRSGTSLIQTIGRAARNVSGQVHMYADRITPAMEKAIEETNRRREKQVAYNEERGIDPQPLRKKINDIVAQIAREDVDTEQLLGSGYRKGKDGKGAKAPVPSLGGKAARSAKGKAKETVPTDRPAAELTEQIEEMTERMRAAAADLQFEIAARLRDEVSEMKKELRQMKEAGLA